MASSGSGEDSVGGLSTLARTRIRRLCSACVSDAGVDGCGVTLHSHSGVPVAVHTTNAVSAAVEDLQLTLGEGPGHDSADLREPVLIADVQHPDHAGADRWPMFLQEASRAGVRALFSFPIRVGAINLGTLRLYRRVAGPLTTPQLSRTLLTADRIGHEVLGLRGDPGPDGRPAFPMVVHQAAGMVMVQLGCTIDEALTRLRGTAFAEDSSTSALARDVVSRHRTLREGPR